MKQSIVVALGTRPEVIKMAPLIKELSTRYEVSVVSTGQQKEMVAQSLAQFGLVAHYDLDVMSPNQGLAQLTAKILERLDPLLEKLKPNRVLVHGDTSSAFAVALACFYRAIPVLHVEAGLRSHSLSGPYPEEFNRRAIAQMATKHFAPTKLEESNLLGEGTRLEDIVVAGNTSLDALKALGSQLLKKDDESNGEVLVTLHRREKGESVLSSALEAIAEAAFKHSAVRFKYVLNKNPKVRKVVTSILGTIPNITISEPMAYPTFIHHLASAQLVITDSGGIQEEAAFLGVPGIVVRDQTERQDGIADGLIELVGTDAGRLGRAISRRLAQSSVPKRTLAKVKSPSAVIRNAMFSMDAGLGLQVSV